MNWIRRFWNGKSRGKRALALAGGGVTGGMFEVGCLAALDQALPGFRTNEFDIYIGTSSGSLVASLVANGVTPEALAQTISSGSLDPYNLKRHHVLGQKAGRRLLRRGATIVKTVAKHLLKGIGPSFQEFVGRVQRDLPPGLYALDELEKFVREMFEAKGLSNRFEGLTHKLYVPAIDLDRAERVIFGDGALASVPISQAIAASSAIPGFFEPYGIGGRDYIDGGVGHVAHADIAIANGADLVVVINPIVPLVERRSSAREGNGHLYQRGLRYVLEQSARITSRRLLESALRQLQVEHPDVDLLLIEASPRDLLLFSNSTMSFEYSREAIESGFKTTMELLETKREEYAKTLARHRSRPTLRAVANLK
ncbi:MAG TPA: patatin-like phospholipase family protein [Methylomirabilota bacterium]|nr:patatin-like phospholipase family protein [Methylomirabilota bacterium]